MTICPAAHLAAADIVATTDFTDLLDESAGHLATSHPRHPRVDSDHEDRTRPDGGKQTPDHHQAKTHQENGMHNDRLIAS